METMDEFYGLLAELLEECNIVDLTISPFLHKISFVLKDVMLNKCYCLTFTDVRNFMWFSDETTDVYPLFTTITSGKISIISSDSWLKQFSISFNTAIEIEELTVLISAGSIKLEEQGESKKAGSTTLAFTYDTDNMQGNTNRSEMSAKSGFSCWDWIKDIFGFGKESK